MRNFKQNENAIYAFLCKFNSFWVIYKKLLKIEGIFHGGLKNSCFFIWQDCSWETASWILRNIYKTEIRSYLDMKVAYFKNIDLIFIESILIIYTGGTPFSNNTPYFGLRYVLLYIIHHPWSGNEHIWKTLFFRAPTKISKLRHP